MRHDTSVWLGRVIAATLLAVALAFVPFQLYARSGLSQYLRLREELRALLARNTELRAGNQRLAREAGALRSDMRAIERVARGELGWVRQGELVFELGPGARPAKPALRSP